MSSDRVSIFTYKTGLLSRVAHDLRLRVAAPKIEREGARVVAEFDPSSIAVDGAMKDGRLDPTGLSARDKAKVARAAQDEILKVARHRSIRFEGEVEARGEALEVRGELELVGLRRPLSLKLRREQGRLRGRVSLRPSEFGIAPYKALAGAIRLQDRVELELDLDDASASP